VVVFIDRGGRQSEFPICKVCGPCPRRYTGSCRDDDNHIGQPLSCPYSLVPNLSTSFVAHHSSFRDSFPSEHVQRLRDLMVQLTAHSMSTGRGKFILRKLFVAVRSPLRYVSLPLTPPLRRSPLLRSNLFLGILHVGQIGSWRASRLSPGVAHRQSRFMTSSRSSLKKRGMLISWARVSKLLLSILYELLGIDSVRNQIQQSLTDATPMVMQAIRSSLDISLHIPSGLKCLQAWMGLIRSRLVFPSVSGQSI
jgi:hypothetical protein